MTDFTAIGFIGFGTMAQGIATGLVNAGGVDGSRIHAYDTNTTLLKETTDRLGAVAEDSLESLVAASDLIVVAVKPDVVPDVIKPVVQTLAISGKVLFSIAWGWDFARYEGILRDGTHHITAIPNTPISVGSGVLVAEKENNLTEDERKAWDALFSPIALIEDVDTEHLFDAGTVTSCAPAYAAMFIEALSDAAVKHGIARATAYRLVSAMVQGTGALQVKTGKIPAQLKDDVCSPGGATIKGVAALEARGFRGDVMAAVDAVMGE